jgi:hypothetical protein
MSIVRAVENSGKNHDKKSCANTCATLGSDREHIEALIRAKGYRIPENMMCVRLVHLLDPEKRKELMIIYGEDLAPSGFTASDLRQGGKASGQWPALEKGLIDQAKTKITPEKTGKL